MGMSRMGRMGMGGGMGMMGMGMGGMGMYRGGRMGMGMGGMGMGGVGIGMGGTGGMPAQMAAAAKEGKSVGAREDEAAAHEAGAEEAEAAGQSATSLPEGTEEKVSEHLEGPADRWAQEFEGQRLHGSAMSRALEEALSNDNALANTELRDFIASINDGSFAFDSGSVLDADGDIFSPASMEEPLTARPYQFVANNPYLGQQDLFRTGVDLLQRGSLVESTRALEAEVQQNPDNSDAWLTLGLAHAENDEDIKAIIALNRAVQADPDSLGKREKSAGRETHNSPKP